MNALTLGETLDGSAGPQQMTGRCGGPGYVRRVPDVYWS